ncbi:MAG TPA: OmpH family outer membrane protein [Allosphingosinicella sp.]|nr:OmpH family outer membrane protein [Allosphingosinicella sp.]
MKKTIILGAAFAALAVAAPAVMQAQQLPPAVVAVVNRDQIAQQCTQCTVATTALNAQGQQYQARETQLLTPLRAEGQAIQTAINALPQGGQPDAALAARIQTFQTNSQAAERELGTAQQNLRRNQQHVISQIIQRMQPLIQQAANARGATVTLDASTILSFSPQIDITPQVLALMNQNATPFGTTAPPPPQAPAQTGARPATPTPAPAQPNRPRPQGR